MMHPTHLIHVLINQEFKAAGHHAIQDPQVGEKVLTTNAEDAVEYVGVKFPV